MDIPIEELQIECERVRTAARCVYEEKTISYFCIAEFPRGWCGCLSRVLGALLSRKYPKEEFYYVCGEVFFTEKDWTSHAWIRYGELILDITADQFVEVTEPVVIIPISCSSFHAMFAITNEHLVEKNIERYYEERIVMNKLRELQRMSRGGL